MNRLSLLLFITASISLLFALVFLAIYSQRTDLPATRCWREVEPIQKYSRWLSLSQAWGFGAT